MSEARPKADQHRSAACGIRFQLKSALFAFTRELKQDVSIARDRRAPRLLLSSGDLRRRIYESACVILNLAASQPFEPVSCECEPSPAIKRPGETPLVGWGGMNSNLRMAQSRSDNFAFDFHVHSEKAVENASLRINGTDDLLSVNSTAGLTQVRALNTLKAE
jgi:hypothetical protein